MPFSLPAIFFDIPRNPVLAVGLPLSLGLLSGYQTKDRVTSPWYENLRVPPGRPPKAAFPIVWTTLYIAMGYASHIAVKALDSSLAPHVVSAARTGITLYWAQLGLNFLWTPLFFGWKRVDLALVDISVLTGTVIYMTTQLDEPTKGATTLLLAPYCAWLCLATYLNGGIWWLNSGKPKAK